MTHPDELNFLKEKIGVNTLSELIRDSQCLIVMGEDNIICSNCVKCVIYNGKNNIITPGTINSRILNCDGLVLSKNNCLAVGKNGKVEYFDL